MRRREQRKADAQLLLYGHYSWSDTQSVAVCHLESYGKKKGVNENEQIHGHFSKMCVLKFVVTMSHLM